DSDSDSDSTSVDEPGEVPAQQNNNENETVNNSDANPPVDDESTEAQKHLDSIGIHFSDHVPNDVTGNFRLARVSSSDFITDYAIDYYKAYFKNNEEIHAVVNFTTNTTTRLAVYGNILFVDVYEYVDKEELDAKQLCRGTLLSSYQINIDTREIDEIKDDAISDKGTEAVSDALPALVTSDSDTNDTTAIADNSSDAKDDNSDVKDNTTDNTDDNFEINDSSVTPVSAVVYITQTGKKYHRSEKCRGLSNANKIYEVTEEEAQNKGLTKCSICY
ncbi:MAG: hypothetical protein IJ711_05980, partial [Lachnospiraceae bacterium]|nr:hypothetical protein [Lachnospiraceae bacterium]